LTQRGLEVAGECIGLSPKHLRYYDAIQDLEYEGAIEWDESARYARGDKRYVITQRGLDATA
jgi:DNA-binding PadR family transcriptional regulator